MSWFSTTRWTDTNITSLDEALDLIMSDNASLANDGGVRYSNLEKTKIFGENQTVTIDTRTYTYNVVEFSMNSITPGSTPIETRTQPIRGLIILYRDGNRIHYIINRNYDALKLLRKLLGYTGKNEIIENKHLFSDDVFMWFVKIVSNQENEFSFTDSSQNELELIINSIIGVRGETRDENKLSAQGDTVLNLISTLSFILESNLLKQIVLRIQYTGHENIEMRLNDKGVVAVETDSYSGNYEDIGDPEMKAQMKAQLLLLVYQEVIPKLLQVYFEEKDEKKWNLSEKDIFFNNVERKLIERLQERKKEFKKKEKMLSEQTKTASE